MGASHNIQETCFTIPVFNQSGTMLETYLTIHATKQSLTPQEICFTLHVIKQSVTMQETRFTLHVSIVILFFCSWRGCCWCFLRWCRSCRSYLAHGFPLPTVGNLPFANGRQCAFLVKKCTKIMDNVWQKQILIYVRQSPDRYWSHTSLWI